MKNYLTFDIGGTEIKYGVINEAHEFIFKDKFPSKGPIGGKYILDDILERIEALRGYNPEGVAISSAGVINSHTGEVLSATGTIIDYIGMNIVSYIGKRSNLKVSAINDVNAMALCESNLGAAKDSQVAIALTIGTGIGGAIIIQKQIFEGVGYNAGEFGLMKIGTENYEDLAATSILVKNAQTVFGSEVQNGLDVFKLYDAKNEKAIELVNDFYDYLSIGLANLSYIFNPDLIVIGGGIVSRPTFIDELNQFFAPKITTHLMKYTHLAVAKHKNDAGMLGAFVHFKSLYFK